MNAFMRATILTLSSLLFVEIMFIVLPPADNSFDVNVKYNVLNILLKCLDGQINFYHFIFW